MNDHLVSYNDLESVPYPPFMSGLNDKLKGMRFGEIKLWNSSTGSGKSTLQKKLIDEETDQMLNEAFRDFLKDYEMDIALNVEDILFEFFAGGVEFMLNDEEDEE